MRGRLAAALVGALALLAVAAPAPPAEAAPMVTLAEGDIIVLDAGSDRVYHVEPDGSATTPLTGFGDLVGPRGVSVTPEGLLFVSDVGGGQNVVYRLDPRSGDLVAMLVFSPSPQSNLWAVATDPATGDALVLDTYGRQVVRIDPVTRNAFVEFATSLEFPRGMALEADGKLILADSTSGESRGIYRGDPETGSETPIVQSEDFELLYNIAVDEAAGTVYAADFSRGSIFSVDLNAPDPPTEFATGFTHPSGVAVEASGHLLVTDYGNSAFSSRLYRVDPDGNRSPVGSWSWFSGPVAVIVVPALNPRTHSVFLISDADDVDNHTGEIYRADATAGDSTGTGTRTPILGGPFAEPLAMAFENPDNDLYTGAIFVVDGQDTILRVDLATGDRTVVSSGGALDDLSDIAVESDGQIVVSDRYDGQVIRVNPIFGDQTVLTSALDEPTSLVVDENGTIIVTDAGLSEFSGLFRVNPLNGEVTEFRVFDPSTGEFGFADPAALARDPTGDLLLVERGTASPQIYRVLNANGPEYAVFALSVDSGLDPSALSDTVAMVIDGNRDPIVAFAVAEPVRVDPPTGASTRIPVGGEFGDATDLLVEGMPAPGVPTDGDFDEIPDGIDNCPDIPNPDQEDANFDAVGDVCQLFDFDLDGFPDSQDNCYIFPNADQADVDSDGIGDRCDNCRKAPNSTQLNRYGDDAEGDACDDTDADGVLDSVDNCAVTPNGTDSNGVKWGTCSEGLVGQACTDDSECVDTTTGVCSTNQEDRDLDGDGDACDNCLADSNADQSDVNGDGVGDVCEPSDGDGDGWPDAEDNCETVSNPDQSDVNGDGTGDVCEPSDGDGDGWPDGEDNCPTIANPGQEDTGGTTGVGDACEDDDGDEVENALDNCPDDPNGTGSTTAHGTCSEGLVGAPCEQDSDCDVVFGDGTGVCSADQEDGDSDGVGDVCDNCPVDANPSQNDANGDTIGDACQPSDPDGDGIPNDGGAAPCADGVTQNCNDNCPNTYNPDQKNANDGSTVDGDSGDACEPGDSDGDGIPDDGDGSGSAGNAPCGHLETVDCDDNCRFYPNTDQSDVNTNGHGDVCEPGDYDGDGLPEGDSDGDGVLDPLDNCPDNYNPGQSDFDDDWVGDVCDESDGDGVLDWLDNCPATPNASALGTCSEGLVGDECTADADCDDPPIFGVCSDAQEDADSDGVGDVCDNCPDAANHDQSDLNGDGIGDVCQPDDFDYDGWPDVEDNCTNVPNPDQSDIDGDGAGDVCDADDDGDGVDDDFPDNCPTIPNASLLGTCTAGPVGFTCTADSGCDGTPGSCSNDQEDFDSDGAGDVCDNCPDDANPDQSDIDGNGEGDVCDTDDDGDGEPDASDNCSEVPNASQLDSDSDGYGNHCDCDYDGNNSCDGSDFLIFGSSFGQPVPPCPAEIDQDGNGACDGSDFLLFSDGFSQAPGPACGQPRGTPCP